VCSGERQIPTGYHASAPHRLSSPAESVHAFTHVLRACAGIDSGSGSGTGSGSVSPGEPKLE
jgi:hypothetical protein